MIDLNRLPSDGEGGLIEMLGTVEDPRQRGGVRHPVVTVVAISVCAALSGARSFKAIAEWAKELRRDTLRRLGSRRWTPPSEPTFRRVLQKLDAERLDPAIGRWLLHQHGARIEGVSMAGKTLRGARDSGQAAPRLLSAILHQEGIIVAQRAVAEKTNEIPERPRLVETLPLEGAVVTADAMHTQQETARYLVEKKKADYVFTVKDHQSTLKQDIDDLHLNRFPPPFETVDKSHGRLEIRRIWTSTELQGYLDFPDAAQVFAVQRDTTQLTTGQFCTETAYGVTSLSPEKASPARFLALNRSHWEIENRLHWIRDWTFDEDRCRIRRGAGAHVMASLRNLAISLLRLAGAGRPTEALRFCSRGDLRPLRMIGLAVT
jgi:predicted transposase YbfD/YdcC